MRVEQAARDLFHSIHFAGDETLTRTRSFACETFDFELVLTFCFFLKPGATPAFRRVRRTAARRSAVTPTNCVLRYVVLDLGNSSRERDGAADERRLTIFSPDFSAAQKKLK